MFAPDVAQRDDLECSQTKRHPLRHQIVNIADRARQFVMHRERADRSDFAGQAGIETLAVELLAELVFHQVEQTIDVDERDPVAPDFEERFVAVAGNGDGTLVEQAISAWGGVFWSTSPIPSQARRDRP